MLLQSLKDSTVDKDSLGTETTGMRDAFQAFLKICSSVPDASDADFRLLRAVVSEVMSVAGMSASPMYFDTSCYLQARLYASQLRGDLVCTQTIRISSLRRQKLKHPIPGNL